MRNNTLSNAFPIVAAALGNKFGVNVSVGGENAFTDGRTINLPAYNLEDPSYKEVAWGYLAHEAAHVRFTDFYEFKNAATNPMRKHIVNILEDIRIEKLIQECYPGTKRTTEKVVIHLLQTGDSTIIGQDEMVHPATILSQFLLYRLRNDILKQTALASYADTAESLLEASFPMGALTRLAGLLSEVPQLQVTRDCVRLADRILRMIEEEHEKEQEKALQQQQTTQSQQQDSDDSSSQSQAGQGDTDQDEDSTDTDAGDSEQESPSQGADSQTDQDTDDEDSQSGLGANHSSGSTTDNPMDEDSEKLAQTLSSVLSASEDDVTEDMFEIAKQILGSQPVNCYDSDIQMPIAMAPELNPFAGNALMNKVLAESGKIRASLQGMVQASQYERPVNKHSGTRINGRKLSRLIQGDSRVFERRSRKQAPNTAIHLLVDGSGSMRNLTPNHYRLIDLAMESVLSLALALEGISGVNPAVTRFPSADDQDDVVPLLRHGQKVRPNIPAFSSITCGGTPLHKALWYAASSVLATREDRKIIMVLTDGEPDDTYAAQAIIQRCEATGIELVGIGICHDTSHLFARSVCISEASELRTELFKISRDLLLAA